MERFPNRKGSPNRGETIDSTEYRYFSNDAERHDVYEFCKELAIYLKEHGTKNVLFADRSARPAWIGVDEYWNLHYKDAKKPGFYFANPDGYAFLSESPAIPPEKLFSTMLHVLARGEFPADTRSEAAERFEQVYKPLLADKEEQIIFFDTCAHTGMTAHAVTSVLKEVGFTNVGVITANTPDEESGIVPEAVIDTHARLSSCYPFGGETLVEKTDDLLTERDPYGRQQVGNLMRSEIRRIIRDEGK